MCKSCHKNCLNNDCLKPDDSSSCYSCANLVDYIFIPSNSDANKDSNARPVGECKQKIFLKMNLSSNNNPYVFDISFNSTWTDLFENIDSNYGLITSVEI